MIGGVGRLLAGFNAVFARKQQATDSTSHDVDRDCNRANPLKADWVKLFRVRYETENRTGERDQNCGGCSTNRADPHTFWACEGDEESKEE